jgi:hypothetical protein
MGDPRAKKAAERGAFWASIGGIAGAAMASLLLWADPTGGLAPIEAAAPAAAAAVVPAGSTSGADPRAAQARLRPAPAPKRARSEPTEADRPRTVEHEAEPSSGLSLRGTVRDALGRPLADYPVTVLPESERGRDPRFSPWVTRTRGDGRFLVRLPGPARVHLHAGTVANQTGPLVFATVPVKRGPHLELRAERTSSVRLRLVPALDAVPSGAVVELTPAGDPDTGLRAVTDAHGVVEFEDLVSGSWFVTARTAAGCCQRAEITLLPGDNEDSVPLVRMPGR